MRVYLVLGVVLVAACDTAPGPELLGQRPPVLEDFSFFPQRLVYALLPPDQVVGDSIHIPITIGVTARDQGTPVSEVWYVIQSPSSLTAPVRSGRLAAVGNNRYERQVTLTLNALEVRTYTLLVYAVDEAARVSGDVRGSLHYYRSFEPGSPPVIDSLAVPDTLQRPGAGQPAASLLLVAAVSDPDGLSDVALVEFWNETAPAVRLLMCDDGNAAPCGASQESGDAVAGDGLFTRRVFITSDNAAGTNTLLFQATDRAGLQSVVHSRDIVIQ